MLDSASERAANLAAEKTANSIIQRLHLDNGILQAQANDSPCTEGESDMAKRIKLPIPKEFGGEHATGNTQIEAIENLHKRFADLKPTKETPLFSAYIETWYKMWKKPHVAIKTQEYYEGVIRKLIPYLGHKHLADISADDIQQVFNDTMELSKSTHHGHITVLNMMFKRAVADGILDRNIMAINDFKTSKKVDEAVPLTLDELLDVITNLKRLRTEDKLLVALRCFTPFRPSEIIGLKWGDIDFDNNIIHKQRKATFGNNNQPIIGNPKCDSFSDNDLLPLLREIIEPHKGNPDTYIIGGGENPITKSSNRRRNERIAKIIDLHGHKPHEFRHTYLTNLYI